MLYAGVTLLWGCEVRIVSPPLILELALRFTGISSIIE
jgi:hypothetical protein